MRGVRWLFIVVFAVVRAVFAVTLAIVRAVTVCLCWLVAPRACLVVRLLRRR